MPMASTVTFEQVEQLAGQLTRREQLKLIARLSDCLSSLPLTPAEEEEQRRVYRARAKAFLKLCEEAPAEAIGEVDSAEDIRQSRAERMEPCV
jgi:hypothetical protein